MAVIRNALYLVKLRGSDPAALRYLGWAEEAVAAAIDALRQARTDAAPETGARKAAALASLRLTP